MIIFQNRANAKKIKNTQMLRKQLSNLKNRNEAKNQKDLIHDFLVTNPILRLVFLL